uniref:RNA-directed DNA polymerase n=1 Tax=Tanacetum cinerariifolium TaxID=118510 RepID=A0A6L2KES2_TANCI|nr:DNA-directed DNA polymerase [Tanacetum cinerariifolium]
MRTRSKSYPFNSTATIPGRSNRRRIPNIVEPEIRTIEEIVPMADRTMEELLQAPTEGYGEAIFILEILVENFVIKTNLLQLVQANKFHGFERDNPHTHIINFKRMTATLKYKDVLNDVIRLMLFPYLLEGAARIWCEEEPPNSILTWDDLETFREAWDRFKEILKACPHHGFSELTQIDTFYNGLTKQDQDSLNAAAGGNLLNKTTREALKIIENKSKVCYSRSKSNVSRVNTNSRDSVSKIDNRIDKLADQISNLVKIVNIQVITPATAKEAEKTCVTCGGAHAYYDCIATDSNQPSVCAATDSYNQASTSGTLPSNTVPNPKGEMKDVTTCSGLAYKGHPIPTNSPLEKVDEQNNKEIMDKEHSNCPGSTAQVQPLVVPISISELDVPRTQPKPTIPYPSRLNDQKLREKATNQMEKFFQIFHDLHFKISFADALLLMPKFASTIKSLLTNKDKLFELAKVPLNENCSAMLLKKLPEKLGHPGKFLIPFYFPRMEVCHALADLGASINLMPLSIWKNLSLPELTPTRMTLELANRSITYPKGVSEDVFVKVGKFYFPTNFVVVDFEADLRVPLILRRSFLRIGRALIDVYGEEITLRYNPKSSNPTLVSDPSISENDICKEPITKSSSPTLTPFRESDFFLEEIEDFLNDDSIPTGIENSVSPIHCVPKKGGMTVVAKGNNELIPTRLVTSWRVCIDYRKLNDATRKDHFLLPFMDQMLERLARNEFYCFLNGFSGYFQIPIDPQDQEKTTFTCPYGTFAYRRMPFGLCNALGTFQREGIVLGHKILKSVIEVDRAKVDVIAKLPHPTTVKDETPFAFSKECVDDFDTLKKKLTEAPIMVVPDWNLPFKLMRDASDFAIGAVLGQRKTKHFQPIHYASKTTTEAQIHYTMTEKEMLAVVYAFEKFQPYLFLSKSIVYTDHSTLKYFLNKQDAKPRLLWWVLLLQEFDITILDKRGSENLAADHLSRLENPHKDVLENKDINENFPLETLGSLSSDKAFEILKACHEGPNRRHHGASLTAKKAYENFVIYKERTKKLHDSKIKNRIFNVGDQVLLFNSRLKIFSGKLKTRWSGPFTITQVFPYGTIELSQPNGPNFKAPTEGYGEAIVISKILAENFEIKTNLLQVVQANKFHGAARIWYEKEPPNSILTWDDLVNKFVNQFFPPSKTTHLKNKISRFTQRFKKTFREAWDRFKEMLRACLHHGFSELTQIDTFYNGLTKQDQDSLNAVAGGNLLNKTTRKINVLRGDFNKQEENLRRNLNNDMRSILGSFFQNQASTSNTLSCNSVPNPKGEMKVVTTHSGLAYKGPLIPTNSPLEKVDEQNTEEIIDKEHSNCPRSTAQVQHSVVPISIPEPDVPRTQPKPTIPYPSRLNDQKLREKATNQMEKFFQIFYDLHFDISFADALLLMPKFASTIRSLLTNKDTLFETNPTRMTLGLADRSITCPKGVAEDVFAKVGKFHFPTDLVVVDSEANQRVPLILGRSFSRTGRALIDVYGEEITLRYNPKSGNPTLVSDPSISENDICKEPIVKSSSPTLTPFGESDFFLEEIEDFLNDNLIPTRIENSMYDPEGDILFLEKLLNEDPFQLPLMDLKLAEETKVKSSVEEPPEQELKELPSHLEYAFLEDSNKLPVIIAKDPKDVEKEALIKVLNPWVSPIHCVPKMGGITVVANENIELIPTRLVTGWRVCIDYRKLNDATRKDHFSLPFIDQMLERLVRNEFYFFLDGFLGYFQIPIDPQDQEKTTFTCPYGTFAYRRMPFGLCNAPGTFHREGIVLGHKILMSGIEVDRAKVDVIAKPTHPTTVKGVRSFLGHAGFYHRFIQDFSKIARPMTHLLEKETPFVFSKECVDAFDTLKKKLT